MKSFMRLSLLPILFALLIWGCGHSKQIVQTSKPDSSLEQTLEKAFHESGLNSVALGYVTTQGEVFTTSFGTIGKKDTTAVNENSIFRIASMTKAITSVAVLQLAEKGLLALDDFAGNILPEIDLIPILEKDGSLSQPKSRITIKQLLTHTSGFSYDLFDPRLRKFEKPANWPHRDLPRVLEAGESWIYGTGTDWAGRIVEEVSGLNLDEYFWKHITGPLGMNHTWFNVPEEQQHLIVALQTRNDDGTFVESPRRPPLQVNEFSGGGGLFSSLGDYMKFLQCILNQGKLDKKEILGQEWVEIMFVDLLPQLLQLEALAKGMGHSLAWAIQLTDNDFGRKAGCAYWSGYLNTYYSIDRNTGVAVVVMTNVMPFLDPAPLNLYKLFENLVRKGTD